PRNIKFKARASRAQAQLHSASTPTLSQAVIGSSAPLRSPSSQNTIGRSRPAGASDSARLSAAAANEAIITPTSRIEEGADSPDRCSVPNRARRASRNSAASAPSAPSTAAPCVIQGPAPAAIASIAAHAPPPEIPSTYGSASGL